MDRKSTKLSEMNAQPDPSHSIRAISVKNHTHSLAMDDDDAISAISNEWSIALLESRDVTHQVGLAAINNHTGRITLTQIADSVTYLKTLHHISLRGCAVDTPCTILVCNTSVGKTSTDQSSKSLLVAELLETHKPVNIKSMQRKQFNDVKGLEDIERFIVEDAHKDAALMILRAKYYAIAAASALFSYLESVQAVIYSPHSLSITYQEHEGTMFIESQTAKDLELTMSATNTNGVTMLSLLDSCHTPMGKRLLKSSILQPLSDRVIIENRLSAVKELVENEDILYSIQTSLKSLKNIDVDKVLMAVSKNDSKTVSQDQNIEKRISQLLTMRSIIHALANVHAALDGATSLLLKKLRDDLYDDAFGQVVAAIDRNIHEDVNMGRCGGLLARNAKIYAIKAKQCELLDVARETYRENLDDLFDVTGQYAQTYDLPITCIYINNSFSMTLKTSDLGDADLPKEFINIAKYGAKVKAKNPSENNASRIRFTSIDLLKRNSRINDCLKEVYMLSRECVLSIRDVVVEALSSVYIASDAVAMLDLLLSLASAAIVHDYVKPKFTDTLAIKSARHPLLEKIESEKLVSNDVFLSDFGHFQIIEGPNMSGKSSFLRMVALILVMAGLGSYVPADYASIKLMDSILSRQTNNDILEQNLSTFAHEMATVSLILSASTCNTLVILDEIGRGTTPSEGFGIAYAIAEELIRRKSFALFATHFRQLSTYLQFMPGVVTLHLTTEVNPANEMDFQYKVVEGRSNEQHYGLQLAKTAGLPVEVLNEARRIVGELSNEDNAQDSCRVIVQARKIATRKQTILSITAKLRQICSNCSLSYEDLMAFIARLQRELVLTLESTGLGDSEAVDNEDVDESDAIEEDVEDKIDSNQFDDAKNANEIFDDGSSSISYGLTSSPMFISEEEDN